MTTCAWLKRLARALRISRFSCNRFRVLRNVKQATSSKEALLSNITSSTM